MTPTQALFICLPVHNISSLNILKGSVDDITLCHYGACDIYQEFGDMVYIMVLATVVCSMQTMIPTLCTANHVKT